MSETQAVSFPSSPVKLLIVPSKLPATAAVAIVDIIMNEEGGWTLTTDPNDDDGGWTYAGMTAREFKEYYPGTEVQQVKLLLTSPDNLQLFKSAIIAIYYQEYYAPLLATTTNMQNIVPQPYHLSCAINCGLWEAKQLIANAAKGVTTSQLKRAFLRTWMEHYIQICKNDPSKLEYLEGWFHRVWRYTDSVAATSGAPPVS